MWTWLNAPIYYAENLHVIKDFINSLDPNESSSIKVAIGLIESQTLQNDLVFIKGNLEFLKNCFSALECRNLELTYAISLIRDIEKNVELIPGADKIKIMIFKN